MPLTIATAAVAQVVKNETTLLHQEVEQLLLPHLGAVKTQRDYANILLAFYGYFLPLQEKIQSFISPEILPDIHKRRTASLIVEDLAFMGFPRPSVHCKNLPDITNQAQAFGALYVLEGSTLGGKMIARMLAKNKAVFIPAEALNFFSGYKEQTGKMWTSFIETLNRQQEKESIVDAANQTFYYLKNWILHSLKHEQTH